MQNEPSFFDKILEKPESYRKKVAYAVTGVLGIFIFSAWALVTSQNLKKMAAPKEIAPETQTADEIKKKLPSLKEETLKTQLMKEQGNNPDEQQKENPQEKKPTVISR